MKIGLEPFTRVGFLLGSFIGMTWLSWSRWGDIAFDAGHELEIAARVLSGQHLYSDVHSFYGPLSYYANALVLAMFGNRIETFYGIGLITSLILVLCVYHIFSLRTSKNWALLCSLVVMTHCIFAVGLHNYILPYTYAATFGVLLGMAQLFVLTACEKWPPRLVPLLAGALAGLAVLTKIEVGAAALAAGFFSLVLSAAKDKVKDKSWFWPGQALIDATLYIVSAAAVLLPSLIYLLQYAKFEDILADILPLQKLGTLNVTPQFAASPILTLQSWGISLASCIASAAVFWVTCQVSQFFWAKTVGYLPAVFSLGMVGQIGLVALFHITGLPIAGAMPLMHLQWLLPIAPIIVLLLRRGNNLQNLEPNSTLLFVHLWIFLVIVNLRWQLDIRFYPIYGLWAILLFLLLLWQVVGVNRNPLAEAFLAICILIAGVQKIYNYCQPTVAVQGIHGSILTRNIALGTSYQQVLDFLSTHSPTSRVLMLPDSALLNYLSGTHSPGSNTLLTPLVLDTPVQEKRWLQALSKEPPTYIVLVSRNFPNAQLRDFNPVVDAWIRCRHTRLAAYGNGKVGAVIFAGQTSSLSSCPTDH